jgi:two-component system chemotaxis response regulator CheY
VSTRKYLIADDSGTQRSLAKRALMGMGVAECDIIEAADGQETLDRILEGDVGVVLLDITMPGRGGLDILAELKKREMLDDVIVFMVTAIAQKGKIMAALNAGAKGFVIKPITEEDLAKRLGGYLEGLGDSAE